VESRGGEKNEGREDNIKRTQNPATPKIQSVDLLTCLPLFARWKKKEKGGEGGGGGGVKRRDEGRRAPLPAEGPSCSFKN